MREGKALRGSRDFGPKLAGQRKFGVKILYLSVIDHIYQHAYIELDISGLDPGLDIKKCMRKKLV